MSILDTIIRLNLANNVADAAKLAVSGAGLALALGEVTSFYKNKIGATNPAADIIFPTDLLRLNDTTEDLFFIKFQFKKYEKRSQQASKTVKINGEGIKLPIPKSLRDNLSVSYDSPSLGSVAGVATDIIAGGGGNDTLGIDQYLNNISRASGALATVEAAIAPFLNVPAAIGVEQFGQSKPGQVIQALSGIAPNPYQTWLFKHPNFRNHSFNWILAPESPEESNIIRTIVHLFQKNMLPAKQNRNNALLLQYPSLVYIQLFAGNPQNSSYLYDFKPCVLKSVSVDYTASGKPAFFTSNNSRGVSGAPAAVSLSVELQEIEFWTSDDIPV
jgi:hypothetical protein